MPVGSLDFLAEPGLARMIADGSAILHPAKSQFYPGDPLPAGLTARKPRQKPAGSPRDRRKAIVAVNAFAAKGGGIAAIAGLVTASETNARNWKDKSHRTQAARLAVSRCFGPNLRALAGIAEWYHARNPIRVVLTRLGGHKLDKGNLPAALKAVEDAVALILGADDGDDRWLVEFAQEPGKTGHGVRIELERA